MPARKNMRTCVGCSRSRPSEEMIRMVRGPAGKAMFDLAGKLPGRGAWFCPDTSCLGAALNHGKLARAFRSPTSAPSPGEAVALLASLARARILGFLGLAARAGAVVSGREAAAESLETGRAGILFLARDLAERTRDEMRKRAGGTEVVEMSTIGELGSSIGHPDRGILAVTNPEFSMVLSAEAGKAAALGLYI